MARCAQLNALCREAQGPFSLLETHPGLVRSVNFAEAFCLGCSEPNCRHEGKEHDQDTKPRSVQASLSFQLQVQWAEDLTQEAAKSDPAEGDAGTVPC